MRKNVTRRNQYQALVALGAVAVFTACSGDEQNPLTGNPAGADLAVGVEVSQASAQAGQQIAVAVRADGRDPLGGLQGTLRYDAAKLAFVGQAPEGGKVTVVNSSKAGELSLISYQGGTGIGNRSGTLVFTVKGGNYAPSLKFALDMATDIAGAREITKYKSAATGEAADLTVPAGATEMKMADWNQALYSELWAAENRPVTNAPGSYLANLRYGNANLSAEGAASCTSVNVLDASYVANIVVGIYGSNINSVQGVDFPTRDPVVAANVSPASVPIPGIGAGGVRVIDVLDAQAIANEAVGTPRPVVCDLVPGREPVTGNIVTITGNITTNRTFTADTIYRLNGVVRVLGATLTILPGTRVEGVTGAPTISTLIIERDAKIDAQGTQLQPIKFTCSLAEGSKTKGCWGGLLIAGNSTLNSSQGATLTSPIIPGRTTTANCFELVMEGSLGTAAETRFGGCNPNDNSGTLRYAIIEYGGFAFAANRELNNLTVGGLGDSTIVEFIQVHAGLDDGYEIFGGTHNTRNIVITANSDDGFDFANGWSGNAQFLIIQQDSLDADKGFEIDNTESAATYNDLPRVNAQVYNVTLIGKADPAGTGGVNPANNVEDALHVRRGARPDFFNFVMTGFPQIMDLDDPSATCPGAANMNTELAWVTSTAFSFTRIDNSDAEAGCAPYVSASIEADWFNDAANSNTIAATQPLIAPYNVVTPDFRLVAAAPGTTPPAGGYLDATANYRGAVQFVGTNGSIPWYSGWTRQWQTATTP